MDFLIAALGLAILLVSGDVLVRGAVNLSLRLGVPALLVSLTIVAFGTSAPELLIAVRAVGEGAAGIALGNVVGSNIANILLVLGLSALVACIRVSKLDIRGTYLTMLGATLLFIGLCYLGPVTRVHGVVLLMVLAVILVRQGRRALAERRTGTAGDKVEGADPDIGWARIGLFIVAGLVGLPVGAELLVQAATHMAREYGISETVIGLTLVAVGTSLPELATVVMAAIRGQADVVLGNVVGSNLFNLLAIIGLASFVGPLPVPPGLLAFDLWVMLAASLLLLPFIFFGWDLSKRWGILLTGAYAAYIALVIT